jgi:hypothetical protein
MLKFDIEKGKVLIDGIHLATSTFKKLKKEYDEELFTKILLYIHLKSQVDSTAPFFTANYQELEKLVTAEAFDKKDLAKIDFKKLNKLADDYKKMYETPELRIVNIFNRKVDQIRDLIDSTTPSIIEYTTNSGTTGYSSNLNIITKAMSELDDLLDVKDKLEAKIRRQETAGKMRGKKTPSMLEAQMLKK